MIKVLIISGSPVQDSSTDILLQEIADSIESSLAKSGRSKTETIKLHQLTYKLCAACGKAPESGFCIFEDDLTPIYDKIVECDVLLFGSPIYFDSVSAQAKAFIDRCNCMRPADFENRDPNHEFIKLIKRKRPGAMVLVGGEQGWFEGARRTIAGFFKWVEIINYGTITYKTTDYRRTGEVVDSETTIKEARQLGAKLAEAVRGLSD